MGKTYDAIDETIEAFITRQHMFFVATAPLAADGHVNVSPKGLDSLRILGPREVAYLDLTGSGVETIAHLRENGRIVLMFCAFDGPPKIVRLHGRGEAIEPHDTRWEALAPRFPAYLAARSVIRIDVERVSDACGYTVPLMEFKEDRTTAIAWADRKGAEGLVSYREEKNAASLDGLPGLRSR
jgi:hypothetical protein